MRQIQRLTLFLLLSASTLPAYAGVFGTDENASSIEKTSARTIHKVLKGTVMQVSDAKIEEADGVRGTGTLAGAGIGAAAGSQTHGVVGSVVGAVVGGLGGAAASVMAGTQKAQDILIQLETSGELVNITQAVDEKVGAFADGDEVLIIYKGDSARVIRNKIGAKPAASVAPAARIELVAPRPTSN